MHVIAAILVTLLLCAYSAGCITRKKLCKSVVGTALADDGTLGRCLAAKKIARS